MPTSIPVHSGNLSVSRTVLRRAMNRSLQEPFVQDIPAGYLAATGGSTTTVINNTAGALWANKDWTGHWLYMTTGNNAGQERRVTDFTSSSGTNTWTVAPAFGSAVASTDQFEIHSRASATKKHEAINRAIRDAWPDFYTFHIHDAVMCAGERVLATGKGLPSNIRRVVGLRLEPLRQNHVSATATSGVHTAQAITVTGAGWTTNAYAGHSVAIVDGTGQGQQVDIASNTTDTLVLATALTTVTAAGSVLRIKPPAPYSNWLDMDPVEWRTHGAPYLQFMEIPIRWQEQPGRAVRLTYLSDVPEMDDDADTTIIPQEWLVYTACAVLALEMGFDGAAHDWDAEQWLGRWNAEGAEGLREKLRFAEALALGAPEEEPKPKKKE